GREVQQMDIVETRIPLVEPHQPLVFDPMRSTDDLAAGVFERGQYALRPGFDIDLIKQEILVAGLVLDIEQAAGIGRPEILPDRPVGSVGHGFGSGWIARRGHPYVEDSVLRRQPTEPLAVRTYLSRSPQRIAEQGLARNQGIRGKIGRGRGSRGSHGALSGLAGESDGDGGGKGSASRPPLLY